MSAQAFFDPTATIGYTSVSIDATAPTAIWDHGTGSLEIGATNAAVLIAQSTSHLIMDAPGVPQYISAPGGLSAQGITVFGSLTGQNLEQGTLGVQTFDLNGHVGPDGPNGLTGGGNGVLENVSQSQIGNDNLTGEGVAAKAGLINVVGNNGDNYFPEGGADVVNLAANHGGNGVFDTVWVGAIDVSSIINSTGVLPHDVYGQAVTDIVGGAEHYVDGYASHTLTVNNFVVNSGNTGDVLVFNANDWAHGALPTGSPTTVWSTPSPASRSTPRRACRSSRTRPPCPRRVTFSLSRQRSSWTKTRDIRTRRNS